MVCENPVAANRVSSTTSIVVNFIYIGLIVWIVSANAKDASTLTPISTYIDMKILYDYKKLRETTIKWGVQWAS